MKDIPIRSISQGENESSRSEGFRIRDLQTLLGGGYMVQSLHRHDFFFLLALEKGAGKHEIDFVPYKVCDHSVFILRPGQVHQLTLNAGSAGYLIEFKKNFYHGNEKRSTELLRNAASKNLCRMDGEVFHRVLRILNFIFLEYSNKKEAYQEVIKASLDIFLIELLRNRKNSEGSRGKVRSYTQERLENLLELLEEHISSHKQVAQYADMLNLSSYQVNAICKETLGKTCSKLIDEQIILESKRQLLATSKQVNEIAFHLGYEDVSYFIRFFKKHAGYTPEAFRKKSI